MRKTRTFAVFLFAFLIVAYALIQYGFYDPKLAGLVNFKLKSPNFQITPWVYFLYVHIVTGSLALLIGPFQIFRKQRNQKSQHIHRGLGKLYVVCIGISSLIGIYLSWSASGGWVARSGFFIMDLLWMYTTFMAIAKIMRNHITAHRNWMLRSYAITFAAVTLRLYQMPLMMLFGEFETAYQVTAWLCWLPNLLVIELIIRRRMVRAGAKL
ncbi:DUF2306 domain-containing protein [Paenibacillus sp. KN14-4R]|uniref:DUF2306 domain-containing protein n=1 Tax=Paenibacillus sp. KN14-4R TaxID=3445773 RepID=UPI003F9F9715